MKPIKMNKLPTSAIRPGAWVNKPKQEKFDGMIWKRRQKEMEIVFSK